LVPTHGAASYSISSSDSPAWSSVALPPRIAILSRPQVPGPARGSPLPTLIPYVTIRSGGSQTEYAQRARRYGGIMFIAILPNTSSTETLLNNLSEADFDLKQVSVVMRDLKQRKAVAKDTGPLKGANLNNLAARLAQAGLSQPDAQPYVDAVTQGKVLVAMMAPSGSEAAAQEMLQDHSAQMIKGLP
jgi:hypothetical protein